MTFFLSDTLYTWRSVFTATPQPILIQNRQAYQCEGNPADPPILFILPVTATKGFNFKIWGNDRHFKVMQNAAQFCNYGDTNTTVGVLGSFESKKPTDIIQCQCTVLNTKFTLHDVTGQIKLN